MDLRDAAGAPEHSLKDMLEFTKFRVDAVTGYDQMPCIGTSYVFFLPHAGSIPESSPPSWEDKKYDILFSGTYHSPDSYIQTIKEEYYETTRSILLEPIDLMIEYPSFSFPAAIDRILSGKGYNVDDLIRLKIMNLGVS